MDKMMLPPVVVLVEVAAAAPTNLLNRLPGLVLLGKEMLVLAVFGGIVGVEAVVRVGLEVL